MLSIGVTLLILSSCGNDNPMVECLDCPAPEVIPEPPVVVPEPPVVVPEPEVNLKDCTYVLLGDNPTSVVFDGNYTDAGLHQVVNGAGEDIDLSLILNNADDVNTSSSGAYLIEYSSDLCDANITRVVIVEEEPIPEVGEWEILPF